MIWEIIKMAFESLLSKKGRTLLSMLGIIIGVLTVIAVFAVGHGAQQVVNDQFQNLSANSILLMPNRGRGFTGSSKLSAADAKLLAENAPHIAEATAAIRGNSTVAYGSISQNSTIMGTDENYADISNLEMASGRFYALEEIEDTAKVVVLGSTVYEALFPDGGDAIGASIKVANKNLDVIGVVEEIGARMGPFSIDESVFAPYTTAEKSLLGRGGNVMISTLVDDVANVEMATEEVVSILREEHKLKDSQDNDFQVMDAGSMVGAAQESAALMTALLTGIAAITLLVSGIGIMNVMFVTVAERTKEIGIAKAIGGKRADILGQFLLESVILSMIGGVIGIILGLIAVPVIARTGFIVVAQSVTGPLIGFSFSVVVGIFFGFYPAFKASRLDPVDALRSE